MMLIGLTQDQVATVSNEDADLVEFKWIARFSKTYANGGGYTALRSRTISYRPYKRSTEYMHRLILSRILGRDLGCKEQVDHINHDSLDNRRENLRLASVSENACNRHPRKDNRSGFKGVSWHKEKRCWVTRIQVNGKRYEIGHFDDPINAAKAYDITAKELHGKFAVLNFEEDYG